MTVKELKKILEKVPDNKRIVIHTSHGDEYIKDILHVSDPLFMYIETWQ